MTTRASRIAIALAIAATAGSLAASPALAQESKIDAADTAWMIVATGFVLMMTLPGLGLFYAGMVRKKNVLATLAQSLAAGAVCSLLWFAVAYSLAFSGDGAVIGNLDRILLKGIGMDTTHPAAATIPEILFALYQMTFAVITVALVAGSVADRMRFGAFIWFAVGWLLLVYVPLAHWVWGGGFLQTAGLLDFAGGTVVHLNAGVAGLVAAYVLGARRGYGSENLAPYDLSLAVIGASLLWVGWFGFNGGSALGANSRAVFAIAATHLAACAGALTWMFLEWWTRGKPSVLGMISGVIAGLGTITPASGFVLPWHGAVIGVIAGGFCFWACTKLKQKLGYDDSLDVFGVHGVGGFIGTLLTGVFAVGAISATADSPGGLPGLLEGNPGQVLTQAYGVGVTIVWAGVITWGLLRVIDLFSPLRVTQQQEIEGLDISQHGEALQ
ncbi:MAG: ammonium transporter, Amt family [Alphaproteobacteria bacterium]|jgi:Amt family ammonium transporter|nr:ammonium transporter, Amt family [Alphaproteobacteria bacterium]